MNRNLIFEYINGSTDEYESTEATPLAGAYTRDSGRQPFSTLNTPLFLNAMFDGILAEELGTRQSHVKSAYLALQSLPITPPTRGDGKSAMKLFKNSSGVFQVPYAYAVWIGSLYYMQRDQQRSNPKHELNYNLFNGNTLPLDGVKLEDVPVAGDLGFTGKKASIFTNEYDLIPSTLLEIDDVPYVGYGLYNNFFNQHRKFMTGKYMDNGTNPASKNIIKNSIAQDEIQVFKSDDEHELFGAFEVTQNDGYGVYDSLLEAVRLPTDGEILMALKSTLEYRIWSQTLESGTTIENVINEFRIEFDTVAIDNLSKVGGRTTFISYLIELGLAPEGSDLIGSNSPADFSKTITDAISSISRKTFIEGTQLQSTTFNILLYPSAGGVRRPETSEAANQRELYYKNSKYYYDTKIIDETVYIGVGIIVKTGKTKIDFDDNKSITYINPENFKVPVEFTADYTTSKMDKIEDRVSTSANYLWYTGSAFGEDSSQNLKNIIGNRILQSVSDMNLEITSDMSDNMLVSEFLSMFDEKTLKVFENEFLDFANPEKTKNIGNTFTFKTLMRSIMMLDVNDFEDFAYGDRLYTPDEQIKTILSYSNKLYDLYNKRRSDNEPTLATLMNMFLTAAQFKRVKRVMKSFLSSTFLYRNASVWDYHDVGDLIFNINRSLFNRGLILDDTELNQLPTDYIIREICFGPQTPSDVDPTVEEVNRLKKQIIDDTFLTNVSTGTTNNILYAKDVIINSFYDELGIKLNTTNVRMTLPFVRYFVYEYLTNASISDQIFITNFVSDWNKNDKTNFRSEILKLITRGRQGLNAYLSGIEQAMSDARKSETEEDLKDNLNSPIEIKTKAYYDIKAIYDNWVLFSSDDTKWFNYYNLEDSCDKSTISKLYKNKRNNSDKPESTVQRDIFDNFSFVDRSNNDIGLETYFDMKWLGDYFNNSVRDAELSNLNISFYAFLSNIAGHHGFVLHTLPSFTNLGSYNTKEASELFETFDYVDVSDTAPAAIFQYIGDMSSTLNLPSTKGANRGSNSFCMDITSAELPKDIKDSKNGAACFVVDYGATDQQIFKNLDIDQSEFQNTAEFFTSITDLAKKGAQATGNNLFKIYSQRSYTAKIDTMGNAMLMPLTFFYLKNVPMFNGTYWITNVTHSFSPNTMETSFQGVRQPVHVLPKRRQTIMRLVADKIKATVGDLEDLNAAVDESVERAHADLTNSPIIAQYQTTGITVKGVNVKILPEYIDRVERMVDNLNNNYGATIVRDDIIAVIHMESQWYHKNTNSIGATGLIQWTNTTAEGVHGITTSDILNMSVMEQLDLVEEYFIKRIKTHQAPKSISDLYLLIFTPAYIDNNISYVMFSESSTTYPVKNKKVGNETHYYYEIKSTGTTYTYTFKPNDRYYDVIKNKREVTKANHVANTNFVYDLDENMELKVGEVRQYITKVLLEERLKANIIYI